MSSEQKSPGTREFYFQKTKQCTHEYLPGLNNLLQRFFQNMYKQWTIFDSDTNECNYNKNCYSISYLVIVLMHIHFSQKINNVCKDVNGPKIKI